jgi:prepilin-type N-terminal cleavage/methylation domain-containing protein
MNVQQKNKQKGFTIIEVVLVLAIAALIFLMVFIALPALQRSQRDTQRKNDVARAVTALQQYQSNNRNKMPTSQEMVAGQASNTGFIKKYLLAAGDTFQDPDGTPYTFAAYGAAPTAFVSGKMFFKASSVCNGEVPVTATATKMAIIYRLEGSGVICVNN